MKDAAATPIPAPSPRDPTRLPRPEWVYLALALAFGGAFVVLTPPFQVPDEEAHFRRAFQLSEGHVFARKEGDVTGDYLPRAIEALWDRFVRLRARPEQKTTAAAIREAGAVALEPSERAFVGFSNTAIHPPLTYLPQAAGIALARLFSPSALVAFYAGRLFNLVAAACVTCFAIRRTPAGKWALAALALTPMSLSLAASLSSDALTNALAFLLVAQVLALALGPEGTVPFRQVGWLALLGAAVGLAKQMYFFLPLSYLLIPARKLGGTRRYGGGLALVMAATLLAMFGWSLVVLHIYSPPDARYGMDPAAQWRLMRQDPLAFGGILLKTAKSAPHYGEEYLGRLGWAETRLPTWVYFGEAALLLVVCAAGFGPGSGVTVRQALVAAGLALLMAVTILTIMHVTWDRVGADTISLHGRYFIPLGPLAGLAVGRLLGGLAPGAGVRAARVVPAVTAVAVPVLLAVSLVRVHDRFFVDNDLAAAERCYGRGEELLQAGQLERAREEFGRAIRLNPAHFKAHFGAGLLSKDARPREAAEHFRAFLRGNPDNAAAHYELANLLAARGEFPEAVRLYERVIQLEPGHAAARANLGKARQAQDFLGKLPPALRDAARAGGLLEERHAGTPRRGFYLKPARGPVAAVLPVPFVWRCPPPSGDELRPDGPAGGAPFFACSVSPLLGAKRVFVFPSGAALLADDEVSWYYQWPLAELTDDQRLREEGYRAERGLRFPLAAPPD